MSPVRLPAPPTSHEYSNDSLQALRQRLAGLPVDQPGESDDEIALFKAADLAPVASLPALQERLRQSDAPAPAPEPERPKPPARRWTAGRLARLAAAGACVVALAAGARVLLRQPTPAAGPAAPALSGDLPIAVVASARVGNDIAVTVGPVAGSDGLPVTLTMIGSYGLHVYHATFIAGSAHFELPGADTRQSGTATLIAQAAAARGTAAFTLIPSAPLDPVTPLVGPRSIVADRQHWTMVTVIPFDRFGNPVADGTPVEIQALHPGDQLEQQHAQTRNLLAWTRIDSRTAAGRTVVTTTSAGKHGPEATFAEVPGWPEPFGLTAGPNDVPADGRQLVGLRTDVIRDQFGNPMLDGTLVTFVVDLPGAEPRMIPAYTVDGIAKTQLQAPREPGTVTVRAEVYNATSRPLAITFAPGPAVNAFPVEARVDTAKQAITLVAGPMLGAQQQFIPDGTPVQFTLTDADGQQVHFGAIAEGGYARVTARLAFLQLGDYTAEVTVGSGHGKTTFQIS